MAAKKKRVRRVPDQSLMVTTVKTESDYPTDKKDAVRQVIRKLKGNKEPCPTCERALTRISPKYLHACPYCDDFKIYGIARENHNRRRVWTPPMIEKHIAFVKKLKARALVEGQQNLNTQATRLKTARRRLQKEKREATRERALIRQQLREEARVQRAERAAEQRVITGLTTAAQRLLDTQAQAIANPTPPPTTASTQSQPVHLHVGDTHPQTMAVSSKRRHFSQVPQELHALITEADWKTAKDQARAFAQSIQESPTEHYIPTKQELMESVALATHVEIAECLEHILLREHQQGILFPEVAPAPVVEQVAPEPQGPTGFFGWFYPNNHWSWARGGTLAGLILVSVIGFLIWWNLPGSYENDQISDQQEAVSDGVPASALENTSNQTAEQTFVDLTGKRCLVDAQGATNLAALGQIVDVQWGTTTYADVTLRALLELMLLSTAEMQGSVPGENSKPDGTPTELWNNYSEHLTGLTIILQAEDMIVIFGQEAPCPNGWQ